MNHPNLTKAQFDTEAIRMTQAHQSRAAETCANCRYYRKHECHRFPPSIRHANSPGCGEWPTPAETDWCGEWEARR